jgi:hypothetical protein
MEKRTSDTDVFREDKPGTMYVQCPCGAKTRIGAYMTPEMTETEIWKSGIETSKVTEDPTYTVTRIGDPRLDEDALSPIVFLYDPDTECEKCRWMLTIRADEKYVTEDQLQTKKEIKCYCGEISTLFPCGKCTATICGLFKCETVVYKQKICDKHRQCECTGELEYICKKPEYFMDGYVEKKCKECKDTTYYVYDPKTCTSLIEEGLIKDK